MHDHDLSVARAMLYQSSYWTRIQTNIKHCAMCNCHVILLTRMFTWAVVIEQIG